MMKKIQLFFVLFAMCSLILVIACKGGKGSDPQTVADKFWTASKTGKIEAVKPFVTKASLESGNLKDNPDANESSGEHEIGEVTIEGDKAFVSTILKDNGMNVALKTILIKEEGAWKVDVEQTMQNMMEGMFGDVIQGLDESVK